MLLWKWLYFNFCTFKHFHLLLQNECNSQRMRLIVKQNSIASLSHVTYSLSKTVLTQVYVKQC